MTFRQKENKIKEINLNEFGIGSVLVSGDSNSSFLLVWDGIEKNLCYVNLKTFVVKSIDVIIEDVYHITKEEARSIFVAIRQEEQITATDSDYGWNSRGYKNLLPPYEDN